MAKIGADTVGSVRMGPIKVLGNPQKRAFTPKGLMKADPTPPQALFPNAAAEPFAPENW